MTSHIDMRNIAATGHHSRLLALALSWLVAACGGGGDSGTTPNITPSPAAPSVTNSSNSFIAKPACAAGSDYTLIVVGSEGMNAKQLDTMICSFFEVYPKITALLNPNAVKTVRWVFQAKPDLNNPAWAQVDTVTYSLPYLAANPKDIDVAVHELTHLVQWKQVGVLPGWIIEGTADFVRDRFGLHNLDIGWALPASYVPGTSYLNGYGEAAAFFKWIDANYRQGKPSVVTALAQLKDPYTDEFWLTLTGQSLPQLWFGYSGRTSP